MSQLPVYEAITSRADFERKVQIGTTTESLFLDFKHDLNRSGTTSDERLQNQMEFCRDISQFSNTYGGTLLIGVNEKTIDGRKVAGSISPVNDFDARRDWMERALVNCLVPSTVTVHIVSIETELGIIVAVNVPPSERVALVWSRSAKTMECLRRTNQGKEWLNPDETVELQMNARRAKHLAVVRARAGAHDDKVNLASGVWSFRDRHARANLQRLPARVYLVDPIGEHDITLNVVLDGMPNLPVVQLPYGMVRDAWSTVDLRVGLFLDVRLIVHEREIILEPF